MNLTLTHTRDTLTGCVTHGSTPARQFTGWIGLNGVIDEILSSSEPSAAPVSRCVMVSAAAAASCQDRLARLGARVREFRGAGESGQIALIVEFHDEAALQEVLMGESLEILAEVEAPR